MPRAQVVSYRGPLSRFRGYVPRAPLDRYVELVWMLDGKEDGRRERILPNGAVELIVNLGPPQHVLNPGHARGSTRFRDAWIAGIQSTFLDIRAEAESRLVGIRFRPGGARPLLGIPMHALTDGVFELDAAIGARANDLRERLGNAPDDEARLFVIEDSFAARARSEPRDGRVLRACRALARAGERRTVRSVAAELGVSNQHLIRLFEHEVGLRPKIYARVARFHDVIMALQTPAFAAPRPRIADLAQHGGYADQPHLASEFRALSGATLGDYLRRRAADPNHIFFDD